jgi:hypothetical protein
MEGSIRPRFLYMKSQFMSPDQKGYQWQKKFDDSLAKMTQFDFSRYGPTIEEFQRGLFNAKRQIRGFEIIAAP